MDLERQAHKLVAGARELCPALQKTKPLTQLTVALQLWGSYPRATSFQTSTRRGTATQLERHFLTEAIALTLDRRCSLWSRNAHWALFFVARSLDLALQNYDSQAAKQLSYAEEELQLGASAKAMCVARDRTKKAAKSKIRSKPGRNLRRR